MGHWPRYGAVVGLDEAEAARVPAEGHARRVALGRRPGVALRAAGAAGLLGRAAGHVLRAVAARALVLALDEADLGALDEAVAVLDGGDVAEEVLAAVGLRWGNDASSSCSRDRYVIRTRNLQDWNLTRYRCANRSNCIRWGSNPRLRRDWGLNPTP